MMKDTSSQEMKEIVQESPDRIGGEHDALQLIGLEDGKVLIATLALTKGPKVTRVRLLPREGSSRFEQYPAGLQASLLARRMGDVTHAL